MFLFGGEAALHADVESQLEDPVDRCFRIAGEHRYETGITTITGPDPPDVGTPQLHRGRERVRVSTDADVEAGEPGFT